MHRAEAAMLEAAREADSAELTDDDGIRLRLIVAESARDCRSAVERMLDLDGASGFAVTNPLQRYWRDVAVGTRYPHLNPYLAMERYGAVLTR
ncbi:acyl-CoA dehydrogenase family protein [Amycolatopsis sulphurea]|uniref:hypothetical protein n=1 Tax=Amycolatopsis sulphurea TaxID=76022 RepID=UPI001FE735F7|nr:hypothetical protein [Amycolatopsis sulphurea]